VRINEKIYFIRFEFVDDLKTMTTLSFTVNQKTKQDLLHRNACEYFIQISTKMTDIMLESALLYQKGNSTPYDIGSDQKIITTLKPEVPFQTHFYLYSNVTLKGCILLERVETSFWTQVSQYNIGDVTPEKGRINFIVPDRNPVNSTYSLSRIKYSLVDRHHREYLKVVFKYDCGYNARFQFSDEIKTSLIGRAGEEMVDLLEV
jgi:hypothetical protein